MREEAQKRIGHLYPPVEITADMAKERPDLKPLVGQKLTVIAWLWARTVKSPNPAFSHVAVPLASTFTLCVDNGKSAYVHPVVKNGEYQFAVRVGEPPVEADHGTKVPGPGANFRCILSDTPISADYVRAEGQAGRMGQRLMAVVAEGIRGRVYVSPTETMEAIAQKDVPKWKPDVEFCQQALGFRVGNYGMTKWSDLFSPRQLIALTTFSDLINDVRAHVHEDALAAGIADDGKGLEAGGTGATGYAEAINVYLAFQIDQLANHLSTLCAWHVNNEQLKSTFARQTLTMTWDFAETNPLSTSTGSLNNLQDRQVKAFASLASMTEGHATQADAASQRITSAKIVCTDPPYYDNIGYADLSDFFYVWTRHNLRSVFPSVLSTMTSPKTEELVATPCRHGSKRAAEAFFLDGMTKAMHQLASQTHPGGPMTIFMPLSSLKQRGTAHHLQGGRHS